MITGLWVTLLVTLFSLGVLSVAIIFDGDDE